ncbi:HlyD family efflux transporter periplasmic adaptor subunit [uncultured Murdochiella sp.]|uniref:HlyD family efflux transporter periplasmic adaptor subunit n=1 Tax=uncultured Murdochiella sp. TaxID=1586095 RepID=UPI00280611CD|nr:hypothetical protein [uncultured Murdochiella sp.]
MSGKSPQKEKRFLTIGKGIFLLLVVGLAVFFLRRLIHPKTFTLVQTERVEFVREGRGAFVFYEYAPDVFQQVDWSKEDIRSVNTDIRYRVNTPVLKIDESLRRRLESAVTRVAGKTEEEYLQKMLKENAVLTPFSSMVYPFSDGYESLFTPESLHFLSPGDIGTENLSHQEYSGLKFVDNRLFYLALDLPQSVLPLDVTLHEEYTLKTDKEVTLHGELIRRSDDPLGRSLLIFALRDGFLRIRGERFSSIRLLLSEADCYRIPSSAVFREGVETFCYVLDKNHVAQKIPVRLMDNAEESDELLVFGGDEEKEKGALHRFDRVILRPQEVKEGGLYRWD